MTQKHPEATGEPSYYRSWYDRNREKKFAYDKARREADPETHRRRSKAWREANRDRAKAAIREWKEKHPDAFKEWHKKNPGANAAYIARRKGQKAGTPEPERITRTQWQGILADSLGLCAYCNERRPLTLDHIEPMVKGGSHSADNVAAACSFCNSSKHKNTLLVWLAIRR